VDFAVHVFVGTGIFVIIVIPAVILDCTIEHLQNIEVSQSLVEWIKIAKYTVFSADMFMYLLFLSNTVWTFAGSLRWKN